MKIGILTLPLHTNYGGILQAYALQVVLTRLGHEVKVIDRNRQPVKLSTFRVVKSFVKKIIITVLHRKRCIYYDVNKELECQYAEFQVKTQHTQKFVNKYIDCFLVRKYRTDIKPDTFDAIVVGSDQIWNSLYGCSIDGNVTNAYLTFLPKANPLRISYAASFGKDEWEYTTIQEMKAKLAIKRFSAVSVREKSGVILCKQHLGVDAEQHLDPTMLLKAEDYIRNININNEPKSPGNMLVYIIDGSEEKESIVNYCGQKLMLQRFNVNSRAEDKNHKNKTIEECIQPSVEQWIRGFYDAQFVITDSFHACVFSILFHKPFIVVGNKSRGMARFISLLSQFNLDSRLVQSVADCLNIDIIAPIDYQQVDTRLEVERERSIAYLKQYLA